MGRPAYGDANLNRIVNFTDFVLLSNNFGTDLSTAAVAVPEPATLLLFAVVAVVVIRQRRPEHECL